jgi:hypothetical protein
MNAHVMKSIGHIAGVVPLFLYVAFQRAATPDWLYWVMFGLGLVVFMVHSVLAAYRLMAGSTYLWVNLLHVLLVAPLMIYIGYYGKKTPRPAYELLAMAGFAALGYHMYSILMQVQVIQED